MKQSTLQTKLESYESPSLIIVSLNEQKMICTSPGGTGNAGNLSGDEAEEMYP